MGIHQLENIEHIDENKRSISNERLTFLSFFNNQSQENPSSGHTTPENHSGSDDESPTGDQINGGVYCRDNPNVI